MRKEADQPQQLVEPLSTQYLFLKNALDALAHPFYIVNAENYIVEWANAAAWGRQKKAEITCYKLLHQSDSPCAKEDYLCPLQEIMKTKKTVIMEHQHMIAGELQYVEIHGYPMMDAAGNVTHIIEYTLDITKRKQINEALRESEANWRSLTESSPDHILMLDNELNIQFANFASPGLTVEELIGTPLYTYVDEERQDEVRAILEGVLKTGKSAHYETVYHHPDGSDIYYETYVTARKLAGGDKIVGLTLGARDITRRVQIDTEKQALTHALGERVKELSCLYGISKLIMTTGVSLDEILQGTVNLIPPAWQYPEITCARINLGEKDFRTENYRESHWKQTADIRVHGEDSGYVEVIYLEGKPEIAEGPFLTEERNLIDAIAERLGRVVERLQSQERIRHNELQLAAMEERERIGRELHDDLAQVMGYVDVQAQTALEHLENREVDETQGILKQLVEVAQAASANVRKYILGIRTKETHSPANFFAELEQFLETLRQRYKFKTEVSLPNDWLDSPFSQEVEIQLLRIIQEALTNVRKHAGVDRARLVFTEHVNEAQVIIEDEGGGFNTGPTGGEGEIEGHFGLVIMRERAEGVGGSLEVRSEIGKSTQVIVKVPLLLESIQAEASPRGIRVLLVDDHPLYLEGLRNLLASRGFQVVGQAHDGIAAIEKARALQPELILMDVQMPRLDGIEATRRIKAEQPDIKILMLTMGSEGETLLAAIKNGACGYLLKSMAGDQFFNLLTKALGGETVLSPSLASRVLLEFAYPGSNDIPEEDHPTLTNRQQEVLELASKGLSNKEIAAKLHLSENTVKYHIRQILERLQLKSRYEFSRYLNGESD